MNLADAVLRISREVQLHDHRGLSRIRSTYALPGDTAYVLPYLEPSDVYPVIAPNALATGVRIILESHVDDSARALPRLELVVSRDLLDELARVIGVEPDSVKTVWGIPVIHDAPVPLEASPD